MLSIDGKEYTNEEYNRMREREWMEKRAQEQTQAAARQAERQEADRLIRQLGAAYSEYTNFLDAHPDLKPKANGDSGGDQAFYEKLRKNLGHADAAPRCTYVKVDGLRCGSPRMKTGQLCYTHQRMTERQQGTFELPPLEDANAIQLALMQVARAMMTGQITDRQAGKYLYMLQTAAINVGRVTFHESPKEMVVDPPPPLPKSSDSIFNGDALDPDLKEKLFALGDEIDRRTREKARATEAGPLGNT